MAKNRIIWILIIGLLCLQNAVAQDSYYFVSFTDKQNNTYNINQPSEFLSQRALERRQKQNISVKEQDLPVTTSYVEAVKTNGVEVFEKSRWFNGVIIKGSQAEADALKGVLFIESVSYVAPQNYTGRRAESNKFLHFDNAPSDSLFQNEILGIEEMHSEGYFGQGMLIAVLDGGFRGVDTALPFNHLFSNNQLLYAYDFVSKTNNVYDYSQHGTKVLSTMTAQKEDSYQGIAPDANYMLFVTENVPTEYRIEEYYWLIAAERADSAGVDVISTSVGYHSFDDPTMNYTHEDLNGATAVITRAANIASEKGVVVVSSAGNEGNDPWQKITFPSDMLNGLAVGSINTDYSLSYFSSIGPTEDNWIKPDVVAMGSGTYMIGESASVTRGNGTSFAAPQVAALVAGVWQAYPDLTNLELINAVRMSADNASNPNNSYGYGIPSFPAIQNYLEAIESNDPVEVYPNPIVSGSTLKVKIIDPQETDNISLQVFESTGKQLSENIVSVSWRDNEAVLAFDELPTGIYFLKVVFESGSEGFRIVKL